MSLPQSSAFPTPGHLAPSASPAATQGFFFIGSFFGVLLYGLMVHQAYRYVRLFPSDALYIKMLVIIVMLLQTIHVILNVHILYWYLVVNFFHPEALLRGVWSLDINPAVSGVLMFVSQIFFARRVSLIGFRYRLVAGFAMTFLLCEVGLGTVASTLAFMMDGGRIPLNLTLVNSLNAIAFGCAGAGDALLTLAVTFALRRSRARRDKSKHEPLLDRIVLYTVSTGLITSIFNVLAFITVVALPDGLNGNTIGVIITRLYGICLLTVLTSRDIKLAGMDVFVDVDSPILFVDTKRLAEKEIFGAPQLPGKGERKAITVNIASETEDDRHWKPGGTLV